MVPDEARTAPFRTRTAISRESSAPLLRFAPAFGLHPGRESYGKCFCDLVARYLP